MVWPWVAPVITGALGLASSLFGRKPETKNETNQLLDDKKKLTESLARLEAEMERMKNQSLNNSNNDALKLSEMIAGYQQKLAEHERVAADRQAAWAKETMDRERENADRMERRERQREEWFQRMEQDRKREAEEHAKVLKQQEEKRDKEAKELAERLKAASEEERARMQGEFDRRAREMAKEQAQMKEEFERHQRARDAEAEEMKRQHERMKQDMDEERARNKEEQERLEQERAEERDRLKKEFEAKLDKTRREQEEQHAAAMEELDQKAREREELLQAQNDLYQRGICPKIWPTDEEWTLARKRLYPDPNNEKFHCAVAGVSGSGKSSLINALRGITNRDANAANVGVVETTIDITPYPHPSATPPQNRWIWYDVPGAGTLSVPAPKYFNAQGLFVFDLIIVVVDNRFTSQDVAILQQCEYFKIPSFIVRSKSNQHINNIMHEELGYMTDDTGSEDSRKSFLEMAKRELVKSTRASVMKNLKEGELDPNQRVYIVSADCQRLAVSAQASTMNGSTTNGTTRRPGGTRFEYIIDEFELLKDLNNAIAQRRYGRPVDPDARK